VFVHGILGDAVKTWVREDDGEGGFVRLLRSDVTTRDRYDIIQFGFPSEMLKGGSFSVPEAATALHRKLVSLSVFDKYDEVYFVAHSMGGLVTLEMLTTYPKLLRLVPTIVTYSTPFGGAPQIVDIAKYVLSNQALQDMEGVDQGNSLLKSLTTRWLAAREEARFAPQVVCAYETVPFVGLGRPIVTFGQATSLCNRIEPVAEDHLGIAKPRKATDASFEILVQALRSDLPGPERMAIHREVDYSDSTCGPDGKRHYSEVLRDTYVFSRKRNTYSTKARVNPDMQVSVVDQNQGGARLVPKCSCAEGEPCNVQACEWLDTIKVIDRVARITWTWKSDKPQTIEGPAVKGRLPLHSATFVVSLPADAIVVSHGSPTNDVDCAATEDAASKRITAVCRPTSDTGNTTDAVHFQLKLKLPACPAKGPETTPPTRR
jgi:pimeloyl-ACP methyl ester carboxylesterase